MSNLTNVSYLNSMLLANLRTTYLIDALRLYLIVPMAIIGTLLNTMSIYILFSKSSFKNINIFKIMKIYNLTSLILTFGSLFVFLYTPYILFDLSISKIGRIYTCNIIYLILVLFFFYGNCLEIIMNLERALSYSSGYQKIKQISQYLICFIVCIICTIIHIPSVLATSYTPDDQLYVIFRLCSSTEFANNPKTKFIILVDYLIEGPIVMFLIVGSNILAYISFKSFLKRKQDSINNSVELTQSKKIKQAKNEKINQKLLMMTIYLTIFSIILNLIQFGAELIRLFPESIDLLLYSWARFMFLFIAFIKHFFTIFFYYHFNSKFKRTLLSLICKKINKKQTNTPDNNIRLANL